MNSANRLVLLGPNLHTEIEHTATTGPLPAERKHCSIALCHPQHASGSIHSLVGEAIQKLHADEMSEYSGFPGIPGIKDSKERFQDWLRRA